VVRDGRVSVMSHGRTLEDAAQSAIERMVSYLVVDQGMDPESAYMAVSVAGDLAVNQVVNWPFVGMRLSMPALREEPND
jgi:acetamidase/formamidase